MGENGERAAKENGRIPEVSRGATHTLADLGIPRDRASRAMQLAQVPSEQFEAAFARPRRFFRPLAAPREVS